MGFRNSARVGSSICNVDPLPGVDTTPMLGLALLSGGARAEGGQRHIGLVIGQSAIPGGSSATIGLPTSTIPPKMQEMAELLAALLAIAELP